MVKKKCSTHNNYYKPQVRSKAKPFCHHSTTADHHDLSCLLYSAISSSTFRTITNFAISFFLPTKFCRNPAGLRVLFSSLRPIILLSDIRRVDAAAAWQFSCSSILCAARHCSRTAATLDPFPGPGALSLPPADYLPTSSVISFYRETRARREQMKNGDCGGRSAANGYWEEHYGAHFIGFRRKFRNAGCADYPVSQLLELCNLPGYRGSFC